jgi:hypothetical protein
VLHPRVEWGWIVGEVVALDVSIEDVNTTNMEKYLSKSVAIWGAAPGACAPPGHSRKPQGIDARRPDSLGDAGLNGRLATEMSAILLRDGLLGLR